MHLGGFEVAGICNGPVKEQVSLLLGTLLMQCSASTRGGWRIVGG